MFTVYKGGVSCLKPAFLTEVKTFTPTKTQKLTVVNRKRVVTEKKRVPDWPFCPLKLSQVHDSQVKA